MRNYGSTLRYGATRIQIRGAHLYTGRLTREVLLILTLNTFNQSNIQKPFSIPPEKAIHYEIAEIFPFWK